MTSIIHATAKKNSNEILKGVRQKESPNSIQLLFKKILSERIYLINIVMTEKVFFFFSPSLPRCVAKFYFENGR